MSKVKKCDSGPEPNAQFECRAFEENPSAGLQRSAPKLALETRAMNTRVA